MNLVELFNARVNHCLFVYHTCALSPSYLNSHVNVCPSNRSKTSVKLLVGCANIGFNGIPGCIVQCFINSSKGYFNKAGIIRS